MLPFHHDPVLGALVPDGADLEAVELLLGEGIPHAPMPVPPCGAGYPLFLQPAPDKVRAVAFHRPPEDLPDDGSSFFVHQQVVFIRGVFPIAEGRKAAGELPLLRF